MQTTKVFQSRKTQVVQLPKEFRFGSKRVYIKRAGNAIVLLANDAPWEMKEFNRLCKTDR